MEKRFPPLPTLTRRPSEMQLTMHLMTTDEARACVDRINAAMDTARTLLLELQERQGWKALGYESWRACAVAEFDQSQRQLYRLLDAARVDRELCPIGQTQPIPEAHARELAPLLEDPDTLREVYAEVQEQTQEQPTARDYRQAVDRRLGIERPSVPPPVAPAPEPGPLGYDEPIADSEGVEHVSLVRRPEAPPAPLPFVMPEKEEESPEERAYYALARQRLIVRHPAEAISDAALSPEGDLPGFEEFERWFSVFMAALRARTSLRRVK